MSGSNQSHMMSDQQMYGNQHQRQQSHVVPNITYNRPAHHHQTMSHPAKPGDYQGPIIIGLDNL
jgi:hypothetical protein